MKEYLSYSDEEKIKLWEEATIIFDTNVLLNLYRYPSKKREELLKAIEKIGDRLWLPNHIVYEFLKDRREIIWKTKQNYQTIRDGLEAFAKLCKTTLYFESDNEEIGKLKSIINEWIATVEKSNELMLDYNNDPILEKILSLYESKVGGAFSEEEIKEIKELGKKRYEAKIPPGYMDVGKKKDNSDNNTYGDFIIWEQVMQYAESQKKDIIFVTDDQKEDWWDIIHGQTIGPRVELRKEFWDRTKQKFHMYSMHRFLEISKDADTNYEETEPIRENADEAKTVAMVQFISKFAEAMSHFSHPRSSSTTNDDMSYSIEEEIEMLRSEIIYLENKNKRRIQSIAKKRSRRKSINSDDEEIENTINNLERDEQRVRLLKERLSGLEE